MCMEQCCYFYRANKWACRTNYKKRQFKNEMGENRITTAVTKDKNDSTAVYLW